VKIVKGWRRIDNQRGYMNLTTEQNLVITKKQFGEHYLAMLFPKGKNHDDEGKVSPAFSIKSKAESFALDWMNKHPEGTE
jgi:hypothetical protein